MGIEPAVVSIPRSHRLSSGCCCKVGPKAVVPTTACAVGPKAAVPTTAGTTIGGSEVAEQDPLSLLVFY